MIVKEQLYKFCENFIVDRITRIQTNIAGIQEALSSETKSSAGDKHETGRAMLQLEREKLGNQLAEAEKTKQLLSKVTTHGSIKKVGLGSVVYTSKSNYFIAISAGEYKKDEKQVYCISPSSPIGKLLLGKSVNDKTVFNGQEIHILEIE